MSSQQVRTRYDWSVIRPSIAAVETVAASTGRAPTEIHPMHSVIDPDALDSLLRREHGRTDGNPVSVSFSFADQDVTVRSDGQVTTKPSR